MTAVVKKQDEAPKMTRASWELQRTLEELRLWQTWANETMENFREDLTRIKRLPRLPVEDAGNLAVIDEKLRESLKAMKALDAPLFRATGQRIRKSKGSK